MTEEKQLMPMMDARHVRIIENALIERTKAPALLKVAEWGSGGSTVYFSHFLKKRGVPFTWLSVEYNKPWYERVRERVADLNEVEVKLFDVGDINPKRVKAPMDDYVAYPASRGETYDVIIVDGRMRRRCLLEARKMLSPGGIVFLHDAWRQRYWCALATYPDTLFLGRELWRGSARTPDLFEHLHHFVQNELIMSICRAYVPVRNMLKYIQLKRARFART